jgi:hypothetical protein
MNLRSAIACILALTAFLPTAWASSTPKSLGFGPQPGSPGFKPGFYLTISPENPDSAQNRETARWLTELVTADGHIRVPVRWGSADPQSLAQAKASGKYKYRIAYDRGEGGKLTLNIEKWIKDYDADPERVGWRVGLKRQRHNASKLIRRFLVSERRLRGLYEMALAYGVTESSQELELKSGDYRIKATGRTVSFGEALLAFENESLTHRNWLRMLAEAGLLFGIMETKYWIDKEINKFDFEYNADWRNFRERFVNFKAWKLDDNFLNTNSWRHPAEGAAAYLFARSNRFTPLESYVVSFLFSSAWELFGEYKEEVSINDMIVTPAAGFAIGEAFYQMGAYLLSGSDHWVLKILGNVFTGGQGLWDWMDGNAPKRSARLSTLGLDETVWHKFRIYAAAGMQRGSLKSEGTETIRRIGLETELISIPDHETPGRSKHITFGGAFSRMRVEATWGEEGQTDFNFFARAAIIAWSRKNISKSGDGSVLIYGVSSAYEYGFHSSEGRTTARAKDRIAIAHIAGPTIDLTLYRKGIKIRAVLDVYGNFAFIRSYSILKHLETNPMEELRSTLIRDNYYHALGVTTNGRLIAHYGALETGIEAQQDLFSSIRGFDRHQEEIKDDYLITDSRTQGRLWIAYGIELKPGIRLKIEMNAEGYHRAGAIKETEDSGKESRFLGGVGIEF